jgi:predicted dehydrogenase
MIGIGVIGFGYWGPNLVRNFDEIPGTRVVGICEHNPERLAHVHNLYPAIETTTNYLDLVVDTRIDAIVIATPAFTHFELGMEVLRAGKHVLIEKPLAETSDQAARLIVEAGRHHCVLMVNHTFIFTSAVRKMRELVANNGVGDIFYYDAVRANLGPHRHDVSAIWDLAVHDLTIMDYVLPFRPTAISATGLSNVPGEPENIAHITVFFDGIFIAHIQVNWMAPVKVRRTVIGGSGKMILYDDIEPNEKLKVYDSGIMNNKNAESADQMLAAYRTGDMLVPKLDTTEPLRTAALHFLQCIEEGGRPLTDGEAGLRVVRILEAATQSMAERGKPVELYTARVAT